MLRRTCPAFAGKWYFETDNGFWKIMPPSIIAALDTAHADGDATAQHGDYTFDLSAMTQTRGSTGMTRHIRFGAGSHIGPSRVQGGAKPAAPPPAAPLLQPAAVAVAHASQQQQPQQSRSSRRAGRPAAAARSDPWAKIAGAADVVAALKNIPSHEKRQSLLLLLLRSEFRTGQVERKDLAKQLKALSPKSRRRGH